MHSTFTQQIPNILSFMNLLSGSLGIIFLDQLPLHYGIFFIISGNVFDFLDGFAARMFNVTSEFGKLLDSFADLITFGLLPAFIMYRLLSLYTTNFYVPFISLTFIISSVIRLIKFNLQSSSDFFRGLPTPANALCIALFPVLIHHSEYTFLVYIFQNFYCLLTINVLFSYLLISPVKFIAFKFQGSLFKNNKTFLYIMIILMLLPFIILPFPEALLLSMFIYMGSSFYVQMVV